MRRFQLYATLLQISLDWTKISSIGNRLRELDHMPIKFGELRSTKEENRTVGLTHRRNFVLPVSLGSGILSTEIMSREDFSLSRRLHYQLSLYIYTLD